MPLFKVESSFQPAGDQPQAIKELAEGLKTGGLLTLLGVTGSGKTFTVSNVIEKVQKPTLVLCHNKTLAAQLFNEFKAFFPNNSVHYFVSYYDYYQPESYLPGKDVYIEKDAQINEKIEQLRLEATHALMTRKDVIIVSSVSCIYGLGDPENYAKMAVSVRVGEEINRNTLIEKLVDIQYQRNNVDFSPGKIRVLGDIVDIRSGTDDSFTRIEFFGDTVEAISVRNALTNQLVEKMNAIVLFPARHFVIEEDQRNRAIESIRTELKEWLPNLGPLEQERLRSRTFYDLEMIEELGYCSGIENYSRHFDGRKPGEPPYCLLDFFPKDFLMIIDESHVSLPQIHGMLKGDQSRKKSLVDHGFRLPSAFDNRPLSFEEFEKYLKNVVFTSATPADYEFKHSKKVVEQIIRPTGLVDPIIEVRPSNDQVNDLFKEIESTTAKGFRTLVTTLTKKMAEDLTEFFAKKQLKVRYLHSEIDTLERTEVIRQLRLKKFDTLVGINLLREGLDIPEVALVAILDADQEGFLRNDRSLIQTIGRAARNSEGRVILYSSRMTDSMKRAIDETNRRRAKQLEFNEKHGIVPKTIIKAIKEGDMDLSSVETIPKDNIPALLIELEAEMNVAAEELQFEKAIVLRDRIHQMEKRFKAGK
ncbi:MAG: excinuclease ABC subunit UvrB [Candidatus Diapherotrites archaeon]|uniref:UvrABC system protein B n=1 Tax=Candidatus Iainarchaeum sp. TaxID=3101447 RepID=A0A8T4L3P8_9ARCH|nr:excinuclease ABC subunit UvrB [Candidatus Diapherotrites archaeon]